MWAGLTWKLAVFALVGGAGRSVEPCCLHGQSGTTRGLNRRGPEGRRAGFLSIAPVIFVFIRIPLHFHFHFLLVISNDSREAMRIRVSKSHDGDGDRSSSSESSSGLGGERRVFLNVQ
ncbi:hypothetical protein BC827DRAFT_1239336 [Russula dissimulans]|nr:hypothetical protein BC827DRAFT_1239336 [Russula dissimulans]